VDDILNLDKELPKEVTDEYKTTAEQMRLVQQLDEEDRQTIFRCSKKCSQIKSLKISFRKMWLHYKQKAPVSRYS